MQIAVLGTGIVGQTLATALLRRGHTVALGSRTSDNPAARTWAATAGGSARTGRYVGAVRGAELVVNATAGTASVAVPRSLDAADLDGVVVLDVEGARSRP